MITNFTIMSKTATPTVTPMTRPGSFLTVTVTVGGCDVISENTRPGSFLTVTITVGGCDAISENGRRDKNVTS